MVVIVVLLFHSDQRPWNLFPMVVSACLVRSCGPKSRNPSSVGQNREIVAVRTLEYVQIWIVVKCSDFVSELFFCKHLRFNNWSEGPGRFRKVGETWRDISAIVSKTRPWYQVMIKQTTLTTKKAASVKVQSFIHIRMLYICVYMYVIYGNVFGIRVGTCVKWCVALCGKRSGTCLVWVPECLCCAFTTDGICLRAPTKKPQRRIKHAYHLNQATASIVYGTLTIAYVHKLG